MFSQMKLSNSYQKQKMFDYEKYRHISKVDEEECFNMIMNPNVFEAIQVTKQPSNSENGTSYDQQLTKMNQNVP